ncbi:hypothetical protein KEJ34_03480 [Candidatus Bathyarchaeota archaeon]|nr:hypothetical protein [Candidatus Bathyarchaeota archaeon]
MSCKDLPLKEFKPEIVKVLDRFRYFWNLEKTDRVLVYINVPLKNSRYLIESCQKKFGWETIDGWNQYLAFEGINGWKELIHIYESIYRERALLKDDLIPCIVPDFGPTIMAAFLGFSEMKTAKGTTWSIPLFDSWEKLDYIHFDPDNHWFRRCMDLMAFLSSRSGGRYLVTHVDSHSVGDMMAALRGTTNLLLDFYKNPNEVKKLANICAKAFIETIEIMAEKVTHVAGGTHLSCPGIWAPGEISVGIQEDIAALLSPKLYRDFLYPYDELIAGRMDSCAFHIHSAMHQIIPEILRLKNVGVLQIGWDKKYPKPLEIEALRKARGEKALVIECENLEEVKEAIRIFGKDGLLVTLDANSIEEGNALIRKIDKICEGI